MLKKEITFALVCLSVLSANVSWSQQFDDLTPDYSYDQSNIQAGQPIQNTQSPYQASGQTLGQYQRTPQAQNLQTQPLNQSPPSYSGSTPPPQNTPVNVQYNGEDKPWDKVTGWIKEKTTKQTGDPQLDLANLKIKAGKARIKAVKAKDKLDEHIRDAAERTEELRLELMKAEEEANLLENQVKFQEANIANLN
ncbi:MAG TPA: hypothetical protein V6C96_02885 [Vampirovibrionales bacterium]